jgi:hypothetical protein
MNPYVAGCADGSREWFGNITKHPLIAGCSGCFTNMGFKTNSDQMNTATTCNRMAGNEAGFTTCPNNCSPADVCADGWHICK